MRLKVSLLIIFLPLCSYGQGGGLVNPTISGVGGSGSGSNGVSQIIAGTGVTISPVGGTGTVTVNSTGSGSQTPLTNNVNGAGFSVTNASFIGNGGGLTNLVHTNVNGWIYITFKDTGAFQDNTHNDTTAVKSAANYCAINPFGLYFTAGTTLITSPINWVTPPIGLDGSIWSSLIQQGDGVGASIVAIATTNVGWNFSNNFSGVQLKNMTFQGSFNGSNITGAGLGVNVINTNSAPNGANGGNYLESVNFNSLSEGFRLWGQDTLLNNCGFTDDRVGFHMSNTGLGNNAVGLINCGFGLGPIQGLIQGQEILCMFDGGNGHTVIGTAFNTHSSADICLQDNGAGILMLGDYAECAGASTFVDTSSNIVGLPNYLMMEHCFAQGSTSNTNLYALKVGSNAFVTLSGDNLFLGWSGPSTIRKFNNPGSVITSVGNTGPATVDVFNLTGGAYMGTYCLTPFIAGWGFSPESFYRGQITQMIDTNNVATDALYVDANINGKTNRVNVLQYASDNIPWHGTTPFSTASATITASGSNGSFPASQAFDGNTNTTWASGTPMSSADQWIQAQFSNPVTVDKWAYIAGNGTGGVPFFMQLQGSQNGSTWVTLNTMNYPTLCCSQFNPWLTNTFGNGTAYTYYRVWIPMAQNTSVGDWAQAAEIQLFGDGYNGPLISSGITNNGTTTLSALTTNTIPYINSTGLISTLPTGTSGQYLVSQGATSKPIWTNLPAAGSGTANLYYAGTVTASVGVPTTVVLFSTPMPNTNYTIVATMDGTLANTVYSVNSKTTNGCNITQLGAGLATTYDWIAVTNR